MEKHVRTFAHVKKKQYFCEQNGRQCESAAPQIAPASCESWNDLKIVNI